MDGGEADSTYLFFLREGCFFGEVAIFSVDGWFQSFDTENEGFY